MKYLHGLVAILLLATFTSCSDEVETIDFTGIYEGPVSCSGVLNEENGEMATFTIEKVVEERYILDIGDEVRFDAVQQDNILSIAQQTANEGNGFDEVTLVGEITKLENGINAKFTVSVDDEGESTCVMILIKE